MLNNNNKMGSNRGGVFKQELVIFLADVIILILTKIEHWGFGFKSDIIYLMGL